MAISNGRTAPYTFQINAGNPQISPTFYNLLDGSFTITVTDANNSSNIVATVSSPDSLMAVVAENDSICAGKMITLNGIGS